ncbi:MFS transporter [Nostoc sp.]|uniref:MFS transporter n=1 Tax=Nostoc sp. TaxID=1180 RepID=UPI002FF56C62
MSNSTMNSKLKSQTSLFQDKNFYIINLVTVMGILGGNICNPVLPTIQSFFNVTPAQVSWISILYQLPGAVISPIVGILVDILGRKQILIPSLLLFALGGMFSGLASNFTGLLGWRFIQGVGATSLEPIQLTIIGDLYSGKKLGSVMAFNGALIGISAALFPLLGGILGIFNWRYTFFVSLVSILVALLVITTLRLPRKQHQAEKFELKSYLKSTWNSINNRRVIGLLFAVLSLFLLETVCLTYIPFLATSKFHTSEAVNGMLLASISITVAIAASQLGRLTRNISEIKLIKLAFILFAIALSLLPIVSNFWLLFIPLFIQGIAQGIAVPCSQALLAGLAAQKSRAGFMAINTTVISWGQTLGPFFGSLAIRFWGIQGVFYASVVFSLISFVVFNYLLTTKVLSFTAKTINISAPVSSLPPNAPPEFASVTIVQPPAIGQLFHPETNKTILLPENFELVTIGKPNPRIPPDVDISDLPNSRVVSRAHAQIRFDGEEYYIQDLGSANGTFINKYPLIPGIWYKLKSGLSFSLGRRDAVTFVFQLD